MTGGLARRKTAALRLCSSNEYISLRELALLAIERGHVRGWVAGALDRTVRHDRLDLGDGGEPR